MIFKLYAITLPILVVLDFLWLGLLAKRFYAENLGSFLREGFLLWPAVIFYLIYTFGLIIFALHPAIRDDSLPQAIILGALLGFIAYATYNLTNMATLDGWPMKVLIIDILWGTFVSGTVAALAFKLSEFLR